MPGPASRRPAPWRYPVAVVATGLAAGAAGALLILLLRLVQYLAFGVSSGGFVDAVADAGPLRRFLALLVGGALTGVGWVLVRRGRQSLPDVTDALASPPARLPWATTALDAVLQVIAVGTGASLGREGAPRQLSAATAGWLGRRLGLDAAAQRVLLASGAGAGLAAVYHVPLAGALFTVEVLLVSVRPREVATALVTSAVATTVVAALLGDRPIYSPPALVAPTTSVLLFALAIGPLAGAVGAATGALGARARAHAATGWRLPVVMTGGFAVLGAVAVVVPSVLGNGSGPTQLALVGTLGLPTAALLLVLKPLATAWCLRVGAVGGMLTPAIATGAALGLLTAHAWVAFWPFPVVDGVVMGSAAVLAVSQKAPLAALAMLAELTGSGALLLTPMALAVAIALLSARLLRRGAGGLVRRRGEPSGRSGSGPPEPLTYLPVGR